VALCYANTVCPALVTTISVSEGSIKEIYTKAVGGLGRMQMKANMGRFQCMRRSVT